MTNKRPNSFSGAAKDTPEGSRRGRLVLFAGIAILTILVALLCFLGYRMSTAMKQGAYATARKGQEYTLLFCEWYKSGYLDEIGTHGNPPVVSAAFNDDTDSLIILLRCGAHPDIVTKKRSAHSALHYAVSSGNTQAVEALLSHGANPNVISFFGQTPLDKVFGPKFQLSAEKKSELEALLRKYGGKTAAELELENTIIPGEKRP